MVAIFSIYASVLIIILLLIAFWIKNFNLAVLASFGLMALGVYILINGVEQISNFLTVTLGSIYIGTGAYTTIGGYVDLFEAFG